MRRSQAGQRGHEVDAAGVLDRGCEMLALSGISEQAEAVAEPLQRGTRHEHRALERGHARLGRRGAHQAVGRRLAARAVVDEEEAAGAVRHLRLARLEAGLPVERRLLVAGDAPQRQRRAQERALTERPARRPDLGQNRGRHAEQLEQLRIPVERVQRAEQGAGGIGRLGGMYLPGGELPDQPAVHRAEGQGVRRAGAVEQPGQLRRREIRVGHEAGALPQQRRG